MKVKIESNDNQVTIELTGIDGRQETLMEAFRECSEGRCTCPTQEYSKLDTLEMTTEEERIRLTLTSKPDAVFDASEIGRCLEYTKSKLTAE